MKQCRIEQTGKQAFAVSDHTGKVVHTAKTREEASEHAHAKHVSRMEDKASGDFKHKPHELQAHSSFKTKPNPSMSDASHPCLGEAGSQC